MKWVKPLAREESQTKGVGGGRGGVGGNGVGGGVGGVGLGGEVGTPARMLDVHVWQLTVEFVEGACFM